MGQNNHWMYVSAIKVRSRWCHGPVTGPVMRNVRLQTGRSGAPVSMGVTGKDSKLES